MIAMLRRRFVSDVMVVVCVWGGVEGGVVVEKEFVVVKMRKSQMKCIVNWVFVRLLGL